MNEFVIRLMEDFCEEFEYTFVPNYSGRGMYGEICVGIVVDGPKGLIELTQYLIDNGVENVLDSLNDQVCQDSMGLDVIYYFPRLSK